MMWLNYQEEVKESEAELVARERALRGHSMGDRVKMLRWLKSGQACSQRQVAAVLGYTERQVQRWWAQYRAGGLARLLEVHARGRHQERVPASALAALEEQMKQGRVARLKDAQRYLQEVWGIEYRSLNGVWALFRRHRMKLKTGRRRHRKADAVAQDAFKKSVPRPAAGTAG